MLCEGVAGRVTHLCTEILCVSVCARACTLAHAVAFLSSVSQDLTTPLCVGSNKKECGPRNLCFP